MPITEEERALAHIKPPPSFVAGQWWLCDGCFAGFEMGSATDLAERAYAVFLQRVDAEHREVFARGEPSIKTGMAETYQQWLIDREAPPG